MNLPHLHYTCAPPGKDGSGFRFTAVSAGVPSSVLREAEPLIGYEPPRSAPGSPSAAELTAFPVSLSLSALQDGGRLLCRSAYLGADYSGRWGNFHAHAVHLARDTELPGAALPITTWESPGWQRTPPTGPVPGPQADLCPGVSFDTGTMTAFARARSARLAAFLTDLRQSLTLPSAPQLVVVEENTLDVVRWIALACVSVPRAEAGTLTFTTYTRSPRLAPQQILGVLPETAAELVTEGHRYRLHDPTRPPGPTTDAWAELAAAVWQEGHPAVLRRAAELAPFHRGALAAVAAAHVTGLGAAARTAAADWLGAHPEALSDSELSGCVGMLARTPPADAVAAKALLTVLTRLRDRLPATSRDALAEALLRAGAQGIPGAGELPQDVRLDSASRTRLAVELRPRLLTSLSAPDVPLRQVVELAGLADRLGMPLGSALVATAQPLAEALVSADRAARDDGRSALPGADTLERLPELRAALLPRLEELAADRPAEVARMLRHFRVPLDPALSLPHLEMCAHAARLPARPADPLAAWHTLLRESRLPYAAEPLLLRTAQALAWSETPPTAQETHLMLQTAGAEAHRAAGTWQDAVDVALGASPEDPHVLALAPVLLGLFPEEIPPRVRAALLLLELAHEARGGDFAGTAGPARGGWIERATGLRRAAEPLPPAVRERAHRALAAAVLAGTGDTCGELRALAHSGDAELMHTYALLAREEPFRARLRAEPRLAAACFTGWTMYADAGHRWREISAGLLQDVLRPVVRAYRESELTRVEAALERPPGHRADAFREWAGPGPLGRLGRRLLGRRGGKTRLPEPGRADVRPRDEGEAL
ncbi:GTPase-associated protein 1-related protein [Streptomyces sp. P6-2-1]|uniref:GTPase-associated protein 1-related protein n=1 Tax=Streptomyces sp. P6-2-1 TaxID=3422591 RepID=UPI003D36B06F